MLTNINIFNPKTWKFGSIKMQLIMLIYVPIIILTPCYTYYMATIKHKQVKPFPHSTITMTAEHYPQNIFFRFTMGIASTILVLIFNTIFRWINTQAQIAGFHKCMSKGIYYMMMVAMIGYAVAIESIDGAGNGHLHTPSALIFFILFQIGCVYITLFLYRLREWDSSVISRNSMLIKSMLAVYVTAVWIYCLSGTYGLIQNSLDYTVVVEWNAFFVNIFWIFSFSLEWQQIRLSLVGPVQ